MLILSMLVIPDFVKALSGERGEQVYKESVLHFKHIRYPILLVGGCWLSGTPCPERPAYLSTEYGRHCFSGI